MAQLAETNPDANIVLMGDESNNKYPFVKHVNLADYWDGAAEFGRVYKHMNYTPIDYEVFCYQRWFCVYEYMKQNNLTDVFSLDSDVLVYDNLNALHEMLKPYKFGVSMDGKEIENRNPGDWFAGPPLGYFRIDMLKNLCDFFINTYSNPKYLKLFDEKMAWHKMRGEPYGICDMTQLFLFTVENLKDVFILSTPFVLNGEKTVIDVTILSPGEFVAKDGHKKLVIKNKTVYGFLSETGEKVRFPLIHFQGYVPVNAKEWIIDYYIGKRYRLTRIIEKIKFFIRKMKRKLRKK
jgi:hypothetical protein